MTVRLPPTTVSKITSLPSSTNRALMAESYKDTYMKSNSASESHTNNSLKANLAFAKFLGPDLPFMTSEEKKDYCIFRCKDKSIEEDFLIENGLQHGMIISMLSSISFLDGRIITKRKYRTNIKKRGKWHHQIYLQ